MSALLNAAWALPGILRFAGVAVALAGIALFGWHFIRANARAVRDEVNNNAVIVWGGTGARTGLKILCLGLAMEVAAFLLAAMLPGRL